MRSAATTRKKTEPVIDDENPEWTAADFARAVKYPKGVSLLEAAADMQRRRAQSQREKRKETIELLLDADVLEAYRKTGDGWQTRINADLRKARKLKAG
jgi:uncharacterized protein (DUF4415 family)